jgi:hypothetical protein
MGGDELEWETVDSSTVSFLEREAEEIELNKGAESKEGFFQMGEVTACWCTGGNNTEKDQTMKLTRKERDTT